MAFSETVTTALNADLDKKNVKSRSQSGRTLSYVEGWHVIAEANRIFGFDAWTRETLEIRCVAEAGREIGQPKAPGWGVSYIAKVRVMVGDVIREGYGTGHGIDRDLGLAHESALKEAETDAMKRAFMTFGNPFGLALYDKEQRHVCDAPAPARDNAALDSRALANDLIRECGAIKVLRALETWGANLKERITALSEDDVKRVRAEYGAQHKALKSAEALAA